MMKFVSTLNPPKQNPSTYSDRNADGSADRARGNDETCRESHELRPDRKLSDHCELKDKELANDACPKISFRGTRC